MRLAREWAETDQNLLFEGRYCSVPGSCRRSLPQEQHLRGGIVPGIEECDRYLENVCQPTGNLISRHVLAGLVLADSCAGREFINSSTRGQGFLADSH